MIVKVRKKERERETIIETERKKGRERKKEKERETMIGTERKGERSGENKYEIF